MLYLSVNSDLWTGLTSKRMKGTAWSVTTESGLLMTEEEGWTYGDGSPHDTAIDFKFGYATDYNLVGPCVYLKASVGYGPKKAVCTKTYTFICKWTC